MKFKANAIGAGLAVLALGLCSAVAAAEEPPYTEGNVINVAGIRTEYGRFDDYVKFLATTWKQEMEAEKKAGLIVSYEVLRAEPRGANDADVYLVVTYKNWAALDGLAAKADAIASQVYGSKLSADQGMVDRGKMRHTVGSETMQVLNLK